jgi:hypothetical protein
MLDANWTWSHSIDDASDPGATLNETNLPQNVYDLAAEKASSSFDHPRGRFPTPDFALAGGVAILLLIPVPWLLSRPSIPLGSQKRHTNSMVKRHANSLVLPR